MKRILINLLALIAMATTVTGKENRTVNLTLIQTTDVHGNFFPRDYINRRPGEGSLARVDTYVEGLRDSLGRDRVILVDAGDILQGQPTVYYYNYVDSLAPHVAARVYNFMGYDAVTAGNHDIETGHPNYDRLNSGLRTGLSAANVTDAATGLPYFKPYTIIERQGVRIAVLSLLTPAIPAWLPENLWSGLRFEPMESAARRWVRIIRETERPDAIVGLFHSGNDANRHTADYIENASTLVARNVAGLDAVLTGHDHTRHNRVTMGRDSTGVVVLNPGADARSVARLDMTFTLDPDGNVTGKRMRGEIVDIGSLPPSPRFMSEFAGAMDTIEAFTSRVIGRSTRTISTLPCYFGNSAFVDLLHALQLEITGADISMAAPLASDATIREGEIRVADMFNLYKYENLLYAMELTGREIKDYLEESYALWTRQMAPGDEHILNWANGAPSPTLVKLRHAAYNFDSAAGIDYTVDVTRPQGEKITIAGLSDGRPFELDATYRVAINSYRGNGGGDLLTRGAGIPRDQLASRIVFATDRDMRYYLMKAIERMGTIDPRPASNWCFVPAEVADPAIEIDRKLLSTHD